MKISIVISAYNVEKYIKKTLSSLNDQTEKQFELIIVNDGSTDETYQVIQAILHSGFESEYKIITKDNGGVSSARNRGLLESTGDYVLFLDGDDYIAKNLVESVYASLKNQSTDVICWGYDIVNEYDMILEKYFYKYKPIQRTIDGIEALKMSFVSRSMWIWTGSAAFRKDFLEDNHLNYSEGCSNGEDQEFMIKVLSRAAKVTFLNEALAFYVQRKGSISFSYQIKKFDVIGALYRACSYLEESNNRELIKIAELIKTQDLAESYFNTLDTCMIKSDIRPLLNEIDIKYQDLNKNIIKVLRSYNGEKQRIRVKCLLFIISPRLYAKLVFLKRKIER
jgi:glycosyltransferase involved in cell wall biosynthesis